MNTNTKYVASFYVSLGDTSIEACDQIGLYFSNSKIQKFDNDTFNYIPQIKSIENYVIVDKENWVAITDTFVANGGEEYLTLGIFENDINVNILFLNSGWNNPYYFVDEVSVVELGVNALKKKALNKINFIQSKNLFKIESNLVINEITVLNNMGVVVFQKNINSSSFEINLNEIDKGFYFLKIDDFCYKFLNYE